MGTTEEVFVYTTAFIASGILCFYYKRKKERNGCLYSLLVLAAIILWCTCAMNTLICIADFGFKENWLACTYGIVPTVAPLVCYIAVIIAMWIRNIKLYFTNRTEWERQQSEWHEWFDRHIN